MLLKSLLFPVAALVLSAGAVAAQDIYKEREALMKGFGKEMGVVKGVVKEVSGKPIQTVYSEFITALKDRKELGDKLKTQMQQKENTIEFSLFVDPILEPKPEKEGN